MGTTNPSWGAMTSATNDSPRWVLRKSTEEIPRFQVRVGSPPAALEAEARGYVPNKALATRLVDIAAIAPQKAMEDQQKLPWNLQNGLPSAGTVLFWPQPPTHSAVVVPGGLIAGYNQACCFNVYSSGFTTCGVAQARRCHTRHLASDGEDLT